MRRPSFYRRREKCSLAYLVLCCYGGFFLYVYLRQPRPSLPQFVNGDGTRIGIHYIDDDSHFLIYPNGAQTYDVENCPVPCTFTQSPDIGIVVHARLLYFPFVKDGWLPRRTFKDQVTLGFSPEGPLYYPQLWSESLMSQFDHTFGYPPSGPAHTNVPFGPFAWNVGSFRALGYSTKLSFPDNFTKPDDANNKRNGDGHVISWFSSNCNAKNGRQKLVARMMDFAKPLGLYIDAMGACLHNKDPSFEDDGQYALHDSKKTELLAKSHYMFDLAFENAHCRGYVTEKVWQPLSVGVVPVYFGTADVDRVIPSRDSIIRVSDFPTISLLVEYLANMTRNPALLYERHLKWRETPSRWNEGFRKTYSHSKHINQVAHLDCLMCQTVKNIITSKTRVPAQPFPSCDENPRAYEFATRG